MINAFRALVVTLLTCTSISLAQGEYLENGRSGVAMGGNFQVSDRVSVWSFVAGACFNGKTDITLGIGFKEHPRSSAGLYSFRFRSFYKPKTERQLFFGSFDVIAQGSGMVSAAIGVTGYGNLWVSQTSYIQVSIGPHLLIYPADSRSGTIFKPMFSGGLSYLASISPQFAIAIEAGGSATSGHYGASSGGAGVVLIVPLQKSRPKTDSW